MDQGRKRKINEPILL